MIPQTLLHPSPITTQLLLATAPSTSHSVSNRAHHPSNADAPGSLEV